MRKTAGGGSVEAGMEKREAGYFSALTNAFLLLAFMRAYMLMSFVSSFFLDA